MSNPGEVRKIEVSFETSMIMKYVGGFNDNDEDHVNDGVNGGDNDDNDFLNFNFEFKFNGGDKNYFLKVASAVGRVSTFLELAVSQLVGCSNML